MPFAAYEPRERAYPLCMSRSKRRWETAAEGIQADGPAWLDVDRWPWWVFAVYGVAFTYIGVRQVLVADHWWMQAMGVVILALPAPMQLLAAWRRRRGVPLTTPLPGLRRR